MFHFLHTVGVKHFDLVHDVLIHDAVHIGEGDAVPRCEGGQLAEMALVVVRRNDQIIGAGRAELAAGGDLQAGVAPLAHHRQVNADGGNGDLTHIFVAVDLHHRELGVQGAALCLRFRGLYLLLKVGHHGLGLGTGVGILVAVVGVQAASRQQKHHTQHDADKPGRYFTHSFHVSCCAPSGRLPRPPAPDRLPSEQGWASSADRSGSVWGLRPGGHPPPRWPGRWAPVH